MRRALLPALLVAGSCGSGNAPELTSIEPSIVSTLAPTRAIVRGSHLGARASLSLDNSDPALIAAEWKVRVGPSDLPAGDISSESSEALMIVVPAGLPVGSHDVVVTSPSGEIASLPGALRAVEPSLGECGNGTCNLGESRCTCPADCGVSTCGDGFCCGSAKENRCTCPADCGASTCGDGCCSATELGTGSCKQDCNCDQMCGVGCATGCCSTTCAASPCRTACDCPTCSIDCAGVDACFGECAGPHACALDCNKVNECRLRCIEGASCHLRCGGNDSCALDCVGSSCEVVCRQGKRCDQVRCTGGARCVMRCQSASNCLFAQCDGAQLSCPGKVITCNRPCP